MPACLPARRRFLACRCGFAAAVAVDGAKRPNTHAQAHTHARTHTETLTDTETHTKCRNTYFSLSGCVALSVANRVAVDLRDCGGPSFAGGAFDPKQVGAREYD